MIKDHMEDYYLLKISLKEICDKENISYSTFYRYLDDNNLFSRRAVYGQMNVGNEELNTKLKDKYAGIVKRCNGRHSSGNYENMTYMPVYKWVEFCNKNKELLLDMWNNYIECERDPRFSISIDRVDNEKGYVENNLEFVTHGYNAWKRNIRPIRVEFKDNAHYFLSCEEASRFYGARRQDIGECLRKTKKCKKQYDVVESSVEKVLQETNLTSVKDYYQRRFIDDVS